MTLMQEALKQFVQAEIAAEEREIVLMHARNISSRVKLGQCITGLKYKEVDEEGLVVYSFTKNDSKFRAGDLVVINENKEQGPEVMKKGALAWLVDLDHVNKLIKLQIDGPLEAPLTNSCVLDKGFFDFNSAQLKHAVDLAYADQEIVSLLGGSSHPIPLHLLDQDKLIQHQRQFPRLTERQTQAMTKALTNAKYEHEDFCKRNTSYGNCLAANLTLIQGPPGSGKTYLLALIIERAIARGKSVMVTAPTHKAIDNLLIAAAKQLPEAIPIFKIKPMGRPTRLPKRIEQTVVTNERLKELESPFLIGMTIYQAYKTFQPNKIIDFDFVVIDEASQMPIAHAASAFLSADSYIVAGDHKQLPPVLKNPGEHPEYLKRSVFEHLHECYPENTITLDVTFRMNSQINEFPSRAFYANELQSSPCAADRIFNTKARETRETNDDLQNIIAHPGSITFVEMAHRHAVQRAPLEADLAARLAKALIVEHGLSPEDMAIVSPHRGHNEAIREKLSGHLAEDNSLQKRVIDKLVIDTVERLQGQERELIIFSLCASDRDYAISKAQFLYSPNRLNVAITRSRTKLYILGSKYFFPHLNGIIIDPRHMQLWQQYYEYLVHNGCRIVHNFVES